MSASELNSIDIDVGGTFTDLVMNVDGHTVQAKVPTTPYVLSVCFLNVIEVGAQELGLSLDQVLKLIGMVRYSTTIAMNRLIERKGPRLALLTTEGHEDAILIGRGAQWVDGTRLHERRNLAAQHKPVPLIPRRMIAGIKERVDGRGLVMRPLDEDDAREKIHRLVDRGARGFVISLLWSFLNPAHERHLKEIIREEYKEYHIGYLPVVLSSDVLGKLGEYQRSMTAILDAYLHRSLQIELSAMWDKLREYGFNGSFMMVPRRILSEVGILDEHYYTSVCEPDWCHRIRKAGWRVMYVPFAQIVHLGGEHSINSKQTSRNALHFVRYHANRYYFFKQHHGRAAPARRLQARRLEQQRIRVLGRLGERARRHAAARIVAPRTGAALLPALRRIDAEQADALAVNLDCVAIDDGGLANDVGSEGGGRGEQYRERCTRD
jgi:hypothetical protein